MLYLWYGTNEYAREEQIRTLEKKTGLARVNFSASNPPASPETLLAQDLFSGGQIIVLEDLASAYLLTSLIDELASSVNHIIFVESSLDKRLKATKEFLTNAKISSQEFANPGLDQLPGWLVEQAKQRRGVLGPSEATALLQRLGLTPEVSGPVSAPKEVSLSRLTQELEKLLVYSNGEPVTLEAIEQLVPEEQVVIGLAVSDALARKDRKALYTALSRYYTQAEGGDDTTRTLQLVGLLAEQLRSLLLLQDALQRRMSEAEIVALTGWKPGRIFVLKKHVGGFRPDVLQSILTKLESLDLELKTTNTPARVVLELVLAQVV